MFPGTGQAKETQRKVQIYCTCGHIICPVKFDYSTEHVSDFQTHDVHSGCPDIWCVLKWVAYGMCLGDVVS